MLTVMKSPSSHDYKKGLRYRVHKIPGNQRPTNRMQGVTESTLLALTIVAVIAFALLAFMANRSGRQVISAFLAAGAWLFFASGVLTWLWRIKGRATLGRAPRP
jgi:hypothetical protein